MAESTAIEWADATFNPWIGCQHVSPGCDHCYAETLATRRMNVAWGPGAARRRTSAQNWQQPRRWNARAEREGRRLRVFCASLADVFDNQVDPAWRADLWDLIADTPNLIWLLLTKRPQNIAAMLPPDWGAGWPHVWLGVTVENQAEADRRIPILLATPAAKRFLSCEPLLGPLDLRPWLLGLDRRAAGLEHDPLAAFLLQDAMWRGNAWGPGLLHWIIAGGESGRYARPMHPQWARQLRDDCEAAGVPFLFKQWGEWVPADTWPRDVFKRAYAMDCDGLPVYACHGRDAQIVVRVGKAAAGRQLDGRIWDQVPT